MEEVTGGLVKTANFLLDFLHVWKESGGEQFNQPCP
jgi:hypothetical protein